MTLRQRIEKGLGAWGGWVSGHRALTIFAMVGLALGVATLSVLKFGPPRDD